MRLTFCNDILSSVNTSHACKIHVWWWPQTPGFHISLFYGGIYNNIHTFTSSGSFSRCEIAPVQTPSSQALWLVSVHKAKLMVIKSHAGQLRQQLGEQGRNTVRGSDQGETCTPRQREQGSQGREL